MLRIIALCAIFCTYIFADSSIFGLWKSIDDDTRKPTAVWKIYETDTHTLQGEILLSIGYDDDEKCKDCKDEYKNFPISFTKPLPIIGTPFIYGLKAKDNKELNVWEDGYIIDPKSGKLYACKIEFKKADMDKFMVDTLKVRGQLIGLGFFGRTQFWQRSSEDELNALRAANPKAIEDRKNSKK